MTPQHKQALEELRDWMIKWDADFDEEGGNIQLYFNDKCAIESRVIHVDSINTLLKEQEDD